MTDRFCVLCACDGEPQSWPHPKTGETVTHKEENWACPLLGADICQTCCQADLEGGLGASDTLREVSRMARKTEQEVHAVCVACPHGGPGLDRPPKLLAHRGSDGKLVEAGPEFEDAQRDSDAAWTERIGDLNRKGPKDWWPGGKGGPAC